MWRLTVDDDQANRTEIQLVRDSYSLGRSPSSTIQLTERNVSRAHAKLTLRKNFWVLSDLQSHTGTFLNGNRIDQEVVLQHGDIFEVGDYRMRLIDESVVDQPVARADESATLPEILIEKNGLTQYDRLIVEAGPNHGAQYILPREGSFRVGRGEFCELILTDTSVSRCHVEIRSNNKGHHEVIDCGSSNGVRVNHEEVKQRRLNDNDMIELGDVRLRYRRASVPASPGTRKKRFNFGLRFGLF